MVDIVTVQQNRENLLTQEGVAQLLLFLYLSTSTTAVKWQSAEVHMELSLSSSCVTLIHIMSIKHLCVAE